MLANVKQTTIKPLIVETVAAGTLVYTDEYNIYSRLEEWGYAHKPSTMAQANMPVTKMVTVSMKSTSIRWKVFGHCYAHGYDLIGGSHKKSYRVTLHSSSLFTTSGNGGKLPYSPCFRCCWDKTLKRILSLNLFSTWFIFSWEPLKTPVPAPTMRK
nr:transposase [Thiothrix nivea]